MKPMTEAELLSCWQKERVTPDDVMEALGEFLDSNGFHDASRELARIWDRDELQLGPEGVS